MVKFEELFQETDDGFKADRKKRVGGYILGRTLGEGSFAKVRLGTHIGTDEKVAVKVINKKLIAKRDYVRKNMRREAVMLQRLDHPNIVGLIEVMETENSFYIVTELAEGGDFMKYLTDRNCLDESETRKFMRDIASSVDHMHRSGVLHRDLKIENLLLDGSLNMQIIDFGLSNYFDGKNLLSTQCGSPAYAAPEIFSKQSYGPAVDVWSIGINMYAMLTGRLPFLVDPPNNLSKLHSLIMQGCKVPEYFSRSCQDLLSKLLDPSEKTRITIEELMCHPWLNLGSMPLHPRGLKMKMTDDDVNPAAVFYMVTSMNIPESQIRESVLNFKPNSTTGTYLVLCKRLKRGMGLPDGIQYSIDELSIESSPQKTQRNRPMSAHPSARESQRDGSHSTRRDTSATRRSDREGSLTKLNGHITQEMKPTNITQLNIHVPYGDGMTNGYSYSQRNGESHYQSHEQVNNNGYIPNGYIQREKAGNNIGATTHRELDVHQQVFELRENLDGKRTSLPDIPKEIGVSPKHRLRNIFNLSAKLRKPKTKKNVLKGQEKSQSMPEQLNHLKPPPQLHDSLAIKNLRLHKASKDITHDDGVKRSDHYQTRLAIFEPDYHREVEIQSPRDEETYRSRPLSRDASKSIQPLYGNGEYTSVVHHTPPSSNYTGGRKYGYIKPADMPPSKYAAQRERSRLAVSLKSALEEISQQRAGSATELHRLYKGVSNKDLVNVSNVGYYTIPDQGDVKFTRGRQYRSDNSLTTIRNHQTQFIRKDNKRISLNTEVYRGYRRPENSDGISGIGIAATPR